MEDLFKTIISIVNILHTITLCIIMIYLLSCLICMHYHSKIYINYFIPNSVRLVFGYKITHPNTYISLQQTSHYTLNYNDVNDIFKYYIISNDLFITRDKIYENIDNIIFNNMHKELRDEYFDILKSPIFTLRRKINEYFFNN